MDNDLLIPFLIIAAYLAVVLVPASKICERVGYPEWFSFVMLIPGLNIIAYWVFAFAPWPVLRREPEVDDYLETSIFAHALDRAADIYRWRGLQYSQNGDRERHRADSNQRRNESSWWKFREVRAHRDRAIEYYKKAIADYDRAIAYDLDSYDSYLKRADAYFGLGDRASAVADLSKAINRLTENINANPRDYRLRVARGRAYYGLRDLKPAFADLNESIRLEPNFTAYVNRGHCFKESADYERAESDFNRAVELVSKESLFLQSLVYLARLEFFEELCKKYDYGTAEYREYDAKWEADHKRLEEINKDPRDHFTKMDPQPAPAPA